MTQIYKDATGRKLTLKKASPEWFNNDRPSIFDSEGFEIWHGWSLYSEIVISEDQPDYTILKKFIENSRKAFLRKYPHCARVV